jgi:hypothetical protein
MHTRTCTHIHTNSDADKDTLTVSVTDIDTDTETDTHTHTCQEQHALAKIISSITMFACHGISGHGSGINTRAVPLKRPVCKRRIYINVHLRPSEVDTPTVQRFSVVREKKLYIILWYPFNQRYCPSFRQVRQLLQIASLCRYYTMLFCRHEGRSRKVRLKCDMPWGSKLEGLLKM